MKTVKNLLGTIITPIKYCFVKHSVKLFIDIFFISIALLFFLFNISFFEKDIFFSANGILPLLNSILGSLSGFFITGLAAVATFQGNRYNLDEPFRGEKATFRKRNLTRREFLCLLFGYLSFFSIILSLSGSYALSLFNSPRINYENFAYLNFITKKLQINISFYSEISFYFIYTVLFFHLISTTLVGLIFLSDRMSQRPTSHTTSPD